MPDVKKILKSRKGEREREREREKIKLEKMNISEKDVIKESVWM